MSIYNKATIMPGGLDYDKHGRIARVKPRPKDSDNRSVISSSSKRHRDSSASSSRTSLTTEMSSHNLEHTSSTTSLDQLPKLPESESDQTSPSTSSSPLLRTTSNVSTSTAVTSPTFAKTPMSLQAYLESDDDLSSIVSDPQITPRPEKTKEQCEMKDDNSRALIQPPVSDLPIPARKASTGSAKTALSRSSSRTGPPRQDQQYKQPPHHEVKQPESLGSRTSSTTPAPAQTVPYGGPPPSQQPFPPHQIPYTHMSQGPGSSSSPPNMPPQGLFYYPDYGPPQVPGQIPQQHMRYHAALDTRAPEDGTMALLHRVHCAIPDLYTLLDSYRDMYGELEARELHIRNIEEQRATDLRQRDARIAQMEKDLEFTLNKHSTEIGRLKHDISNGEKRCKELQDKLAAERKSSEVLQTVNEDLRAEQKQTEKRHSEEKAALAQGFSHQKDKLGAEHRTNQRAMHEQLQQQMRKAEAAITCRIADASKAHEEEKQHLENRWTKQRRELEERYARAQEDLKNALEAKQKVVDEERQTYLQARDCWDKERNDMVNRFEEERVLVQKASEEQREALIARFQQEKEDILKQVSQTQSRTEKDESILRLQREIEALKAGWDSDKFRFQKATADFKATAKTLNEQNTKMQKLTEAFTDTLDSKGK